MPESIFGGISPLPEDIADRSTLEHSVESLSGRELLRRLIIDKLEYREPHFTTIKYEKPCAAAENDVISVSFSHTPDTVAAIVSKQWVVGIDMERTGRHVNSRLAERMQHQDESFKLYENNPIIRIWTMKEAALKAIGTGLRKPMNSVLISQDSEDLFSVRLFDDINATICSFQKEDQWISVCYIRPELTISFLSEAYVPIQTGRNSK